MVVEITGSRWKYGAYLGGCLLFVAGGLLGSAAGDVRGEIGVIFFGLGVVVFSWLLVQPQRLLLDDEGFIVVGGLTWSPEKVRWRDVERFFVWRAGRGPAMVGFNYKPEARKALGILNLRPLYGADAALPKGWSQSSEELVELLNGYLLKAQN